MKLLKPRLKRKSSTQSGQGMTEYILLIVVVIGVAAVFKEPIKKMVGDKMSSVSGSVQGFSE